MKNLNLFIAAFFIAVLGLSTARGGDLLNGGPDLKPESFSIHRNVTGTVDKIEGGLIFLKTEEGTVRNFAVK